MIVDIIDYIGKYEDGIYVSISLKFQDKYYDGIFFYKKELVALTVDDKLEEIMGCLIEDHEEYKDTIINILKDILPYEEAINITKELSKEDLGM